jgi:predicted amidohydrolase
MKKLEILLTVPELSGTEIQITEWRKSLNLYIKSKEIDLIVYPESYFDAYNEEKALEIVKSWKHEIPVIASYNNTSNRGIWAVFYNPKPKNGDTDIKYYAKHSSANKLAFELYDYKAIQQALFSPISLNGYNIQINICHDIFFPLITKKLMTNNADLLINLTGGGVIMKKWHNVFSGRSVEYKNIPIFCTMNFENDKDSAFGFLNGKLIQPTNIIEEESYSWQYHFSFPPVTFDADFSNKNELSDKIYSDFRIGIEQSTKSDISLISNKKKLVISDNTTEIPENQILDTWFYLKKKNIAIMQTSYANLHSSLFLYDKFYKGKSGELTTNSENYFVVYFSSENIDLEEAFALMKLRAIESRIGVIVYAPNFKGLIKTNSYKNIQYFEPIDGVIGTNLKCLGGINSIFTEGIPQNLKNEYLALKD